MTDADETQTFRFDKSHSNSSTPNNHTAERDQRRSTMGLDDELMARRPNLRFSAGVQSDESDDDM